MWLALLRRFWQPLVALAAAGLIWWAVDDYGDRREAAANARWQAQFAQAEKRAAEAEDRNRALERASKAISEEWERRHAESTKDLIARAADAERRIAVLVRDISSRPISCPVPGAGGASGEPDAAASVESGALRAGEDLADLARRCESDALRLGQLQQWVRDQRAILNQPSR